MQIGDKVECQDFGPASFKRGWRSPKKWPRQHFLNNVTKVGHWRTAAGHFNCKSVIQKYGQLICAKCAHYHSCYSSCPTSQKTQINLKELGFFFWNKHNFAADPLNKNICKKKCTAKRLMCPTCLYKLQPAPEIWWCPDRCFFFFLSQNGKQPQKIDVPLVLRRCKSR